MKRVVRFELSELEPDRAEPATPRASTRAADAAPSVAQTPAPKRPPTPLPDGRQDAFSELEIAFFEQDLQKVEEVDTFEDLVQDIPEPTSPWGRIFGRGKKSPDTGRRDEAVDKPKQLPRPPHKRK